MQLLATKRSKRGYYIRRVKDGLWSTFGINRIKPFGDNYSKQKMKEWKSSDLTRKAHEDLYKPSDSNDANSDTYVTLIFKYAFTVEKERTNANATWTQAVLEAIFDKKHLSSKIDSDVVDSWTETITDTELVNIQLNLYNF